MNELKAALNAHGDHLPTVLAALDKFQAHCWVNMDELPEDTLTIMMNRHSVYIHRYMVDALIRKEPKKEDELLILLDEDSGIFDVIDTMGHFLLDDWMEDAIVSGWQGPVIDRLFALGASITYSIRGQLGQIARENRPLQNANFILSAFNYLEFNVPVYWGRAWTEAIRSGNVEFLNYIRYQCDTYEKPTLDDIALACKYHQTKMVQELVYLYGKTDSQMIMDLIENGYVDEAVTYISYSKLSTMDILQLTPQLVNHRQLFSTVLFMIPSSVAQCII